MRRLPHYYDFLSHDVSAVPTTPKLFSIVSHCTRHAETSDRFITRFAPLHCRGFIPAPRKFGRGISLLMRIMKIQISPRRSWTCLGSSCSGQPLRVGNVGLKWAGREEGSREGVLRGGRSIESEVGVKANPISLFTMCRNPRAGGDTSSWRHRRFSAHVQQHASGPDHPRVPSPPRSAVRRPAIIDSTWGSGRLS